MTSNNAMPADELATALRAGADGSRPDQAAVELLISSGWHKRADFQEFIKYDHGAAYVQWRNIEPELDEANKLDPTSSTELRMLNLAGSLAGRMLLRESVRDTLQSSGPVHFREALDAISKLKG